jgi:ribonuclease J
MREREILANDGFVVVNLSIDRNSSRLREEPEIITRGFVYEPDAEELLADTRRMVKETLSSSSNGRLRSDLEQSIKAYLYTKTKRRPMVFVMVSQS